MSTETEWGVQVTRPGHALTIMHVGGAPHDPAELVRAYRAIGVTAELVRREVTYSPWTVQPSPIARRSPRREPGGGP